MPGLIAPDQRFSDDDGSCDRGLAAALADYAAARCGEHAVLAALVQARLLVPVVAAVARPHAGCAAEPRGATSEMALPLLTGRDGRMAMAAFTSLGSLTRWRPQARPIPAAARSVCQAAVADAVPAVVVDVAGPVPLVVEGARLAALAAGRVPQPPADDPDVRAAVFAAVAAEPAVAAASLRAGSGETDLTVNLVLAPAIAGAEAQQAVRRTAAAIMTALAGRFRRGIEVTAAPGRPSAPPR